MANWYSTKEPVVVNYRAWTLVNDTCGLPDCNFWNSGVVVDGVRPPGSKGTSRYAQHAMARSS